MSADAPTPSSSPAASAASAASAPAASPLRSLPCAHCGQPVPPARLPSTEMPSAEPSSPMRAEHPSTSDITLQAFCCDGCQTVYAVLHGAGLEQYYQIREATGGQDQPAPLVTDQFEALDADAFTQKHVRLSADGKAQVDLYLEGVHCAACVWLVEKLPAVDPGCTQARLDFTRARATLEWDPTRTKLSALARALGGLGYRPHPWRQGEVALLRRAEERRLWMRIGVAAAVTMNVMFLAIALYAGEFNGMDPELEQLFRWASLVVFLPSVGWSAWPFFSGALASLRSGVLHMDLPLSLGILVGAVASAYRVIVGRGDVYFDSLAMLITLLLTARWFQRRGQRAAGEAAELLQALTSSTARVVEGEVEKTLPVDALLPGMRVRVRANEAIPADGLVLEGASHLNRAVLSGESEPVPVQVGETVFAGTLNLESPLLIVLTATGEETRVGKLMRMMEAAAARRAPIVQLADRLTGYFVATVLTLALFTAIGWSFVSADAAITHVVALLIVTCPCALGMATPVALAVAIGRAARAGVLIKGGDAVERLARARYILLDKTGTLTEGSMSLTSLEGDGQAKALLFSLERSSLHPLARAVVRGLGDQPVLPVSEVREVPGSGLLASFEGQEVVLGALRFLEARGIVLEAAVREQLEQVLSRGHTPVVLGVGGQVRAVAGFGDPIRQDTKEALDRLKGLGFRVGILSGDDPKVVSRVGALLGLPPEEVRGGLSPEQKLAAVEAALRAGEVVMVGDGVNDAAALSAASVGIGVHGGAEASLAAADIFLTKPGLLPVVTCVEGARATLGVVRRNLVFSVGYNVLGAGLAVVGWMGPLLAALLMPFSSGTVVGSSLVGGGFREGRG
ncbi:MAG: heavy metal translocating P-type ATPase [Myxococcota bacterium]